LREVEDACKRNKEAGDDGRLDTVEQAALVRSMLDIGNRWPRGTAPQAEVDRRTGFVVGLGVGLPALPGTHW